MTPLGILVDRYPRRQFLLASRLLFLIIALGYLLSNSFIVFMMLQVINGLAHGLGVPSYISMVLTRVNREERGTLMAKLSTLPQIISVPAPIIGGYLYERLGFGFILNIRIIFIIATILIILTSIKSRKADKLST